MRDLLNRLGLDTSRPLSGVYADGWIEAPGGASIDSINPSTGELLGQVIEGSVQDYEACVAACQSAQQRWQALPAPARGEIMRRCGEALRESKTDLGALVTLEMGKIRAEGEGEVQEMIDIADFAVGLSRQLYGLSMHSERPGHRMYEQWHPLGTIGVISAFNFPVAVWSWNAFIAAVCGDTTVWKPSPITPLCALAVQNIVNRVMEPAGFAGVFSTCVGPPESVGETMLADRRLPLISATGSVRMGKRVGEVVGARLGRSLLELGGNNGLTVLDDADLKLALTGVLFGAVGTAGQRCTSTRRVMLQKGIAAPFTERLVSAYGQVRIGDPLAAGTLMGPLIHQGSVDAMFSAVATVRDAGAEILCGGERASVAGCEGGFFVQPTIARVPSDFPLLQEETFAPLLYLVEVDDIEHAIALNNGVPQGLSSAVFTGAVKSAERFLSSFGSDCGIANVNIGTSGAEIGGAFGGEKDTGGGREAGSDSWKAYMRRQTCTINYSDELPLAQGIQFG
ncbi:MAG: aldehyde dehydrogenase family protein [Planctomycetota bacterium]|nr:MAG: aldehyde dehydrogenase family protein [Planctomycetota bacterium]